jgi:hypothetical protein
MTTPTQDKHHRSAAAEIAGLATALDLKLPSSALVRAAYEHAQEMSDPWLFNHVVRSWLFAAALAQAQQLKHDAELVAASTLLHDIGLTTAFTGEVRFEVFGTNAARDFVACRGVDARGQQIIWDAIALHTTRRLRTSRRSKWLAANVALEWTTEVRARLKRFLTCTISGRSWRSARESAVHG